MWPGRFTKTTRRRLSQRTTLVVLAVVSAFVALGITLAAGATSAPAPTITSKPANPTNQTSASFTYTDSQAGVTFQCQLDGAGYSACPSSGIKYPGPLANGSHTFSVQALSGKKTSSAASYTWTIDTTPPTITLSFPRNGGLYGAALWNLGCSGGPGVCGSASDPDGVASVKASILQQSTGKYWSGASFSSTSEVFNTATGTTSWRYPLAVPSPDGSYAIHVRASDALGNATPAGSQVSATFTIDTTPPPPPMITSGPGATTTSTTATFTFTDSQAGVGFLCSRDGGSPSICSSPKTYESLSLGAHTFSVRAFELAGNVSTPASYSWTIVKSAEGMPFTITGSLSELLAPGLTRTLPLTISNPNSVPIHVTSLVVTVQSGSSNPGCDGPTNVQVTQSNASEANPLTVPANGQVTLPSGTVGAPQVLMKDLASNQDACKGASFTFKYSGSAHS
jgi:hypothetical protein